MDPAARSESAEPGTILAALRERIVAYAASRISRDVAEDLAQEVLLVVHTKYGHVERLEELLPLCLQILRYKMMALYRKSGRRGEYAQVPVEEYPVADGHPNPEVLAERKEISTRLAEAVKKLGADCRKLLRLKLEGLSFAEIQKVLGAKTINTVYTWDFRCRKHLLELMGGSWEGRK